MEEDPPKRPRKAYENRDFLESRSGRPLRILAEHMEPESRFEKYGVDDTIVFFGSSRTLSRDDAGTALDAAREHGGDIEAAESRLAMSRYYEDSRELARRLTEWSKSLKVGNRRFVICTGGGPGIMEAANREVELAGANKAGMFIHLMPLFGGGLAVVFLGETPRLFHAVGLVLILSGIYFVTRRERS